MVHICEVNAENYESRKANAKLIAASPELLEALKLCIKLMELADLTDGYQYQIAQNAISKALTL